MEVRIGLSGHEARALTVDSSLSEDDLYNALAQALKEAAPLRLSDDKHTVIVPSTEIAYVEVVKETAQRVGFGFNA